jgi:hypothetical protein
MPIVLTPELEKLVNEEIKSAISIRRTKFCAKVCYAERA